VALAHRSGTERPESTAVDSAVMIYSSVKLPSPSWATTRAKGAPIVTTV
jgi:hypothetical protein